MSFYTSYPRTFAVFAVIINHGLHLFSFGRFTWWRSGGDVYDDLGAGLGLVSDMAVCCVRKLCLRCGTVFLVFAGDPMAKIWVFFCI